MTTGDRTFCAKAGTAALRVCRRLCRHSLFAAVWRAPGGETLMLILTSPPAFRRPRSERVSSITACVLERRSFCRRSTAPGGVAASAVSAGVASGVSCCARRACSRGRRSRAGQGCLGSAVERPLPMPFAPVTGSGLLTSSGSLPTLVAGGTTSAGILTARLSPHSSPAAVSRFAGPLHKLSEWPSDTRQTNG